MTARGPGDASEMPHGSARAGASAAGSRVATASDAVSLPLRPPLASSAPMEPASASILPPGLTSSSLGACVVHESVCPSAGSELLASGTWSDLGTTVVEQKLYNVRFKSLVPSPDGKNRYLKVTKVRGVPGTETQIAVSAGGLPPGALQPSDAEGPPGCDNVTQWCAEQAMRSAGPSVSASADRPLWVRSPVPSTGSRLIQGGSIGDSPDLSMGAPGVAEPLAADGIAVSVPSSCAGPALRVSANVMLFRCFFGGEAAAGSRADGRGGGGGDGGGDRCSGDGGGGHIDVDGGNGGDCGCGGGNDGRCSNDGMHPDVARDIRFLCDPPARVATSGASRSDGRIGGYADSCCCCPCSHRARGERCHGVWAEARCSPCVHVTVNTGVTLTGGQFQPAHPHGTLSSQAANAAYQTPLPPPLADPAGEPWGGVPRQLGPEGWWGR